EGGRARVGASTHPERGDPAVAGHPALTGAEEALVELAAPVAPVGTDLEAVAERRGAASGVCRGRAGDAHREQDREHGQEPRGPHTRTSPAGSSAVVRRRRARLYRSRTAPAY